jgi:hypothetical protein
VNKEQQRAWLEGVLGGPAGFMAYMEHEAGTDIVFEMGSVEDRDVALDILYNACAFVLRCLANPRCEGSEDVIRVMMEARAEKARKEEP